MNGTDGPLMTLQRSQSLGHHAEQLTVGSPVLPGLLGGGHPVECHRRGHGHGMDHGISLVERQGSLTRPTMIQRQRSLAPDLLRYLPNIIERDDSKDVNATDREDKANPLTLLDRQASQALLPRQKELSHTHGLERTRTADRGGVVLPRAQSLDGLPPLPPGAGGGGCCGFVDRHARVLLGAAGGLLALLVVLLALSARGRLGPVPGCAQHALNMHGVVEPWCGADPFPPTPFPAEYWFVKTFNTGGTTLSGVFRHVSTHYGIVTVRRSRVHNVQSDVFMLNRTADYTAMKELKQAIVDAYNATDNAPIALDNHLKFSEAKAAMFRQPPLLFTAVRHPLTRIYSQFFDDECTQVNEAERGPVSNCRYFGRNVSFAREVMARDTLKNRWRYVMQYPHNYLYAYLRGNASTVEAAVKKYDFIFVAERMDEALVAFMLSYGLKYEDIAYVSSRNKTGWYKPADVMPAQLNNYVVQQNKQDLRLWELANARLDAVVENIVKRCGADAWAEVLSTFQRILGVVTKECAEYEAWYADHGFKPPYGYVVDNGLAFRCVRYAVQRVRAGAA